MPVDGPPGHRRLVKCPKCKQLLEETGSAQITCHYCGTTINAEEQVKLREKESREELIRLEVDLRKKIRKQIMWRNTSYILAGISFTVSALVFGIYYRGIMTHLSSQWPYLSGYGVIVLTWVVLAFLFTAKVNKTKGILSDITR